MTDPFVIIRAPRSFTAEREYLADILFSQLMCLPYRLVFHDERASSYTLQMNEGEIVIEDDFFSRTDEQKGYLYAEMMPKTVRFDRNEFTIEKDVPVFYGSGRISVEPGMIHCGHDLFAQIFFMLTRWEENVIRETDYLQRFPADASLAMKHHFLHRPVVNEWLGMLMNMIRKIAPGAPIRLTQSFQLIFTHDIDLLNAPISLREFAKDVLKRKSAGAFATRLKYLASGANPYNLFDYFMDVSEKNNTLSRFYFMTGHHITGKDGEPYNSSPLYRKVLRRIKERGHVAGFHPSLLTYNNAAMFLQEKLQLENDLGQRVYEGRQHALRFEMPGTWNIWENNEMETDSTMGYSAQEGFRCGTGCIFRTFDVISRKALSLKEMPLIVMDTTLHVNRKLGLEESGEIVRNFIEISRTYQMPVTLLFHNLIDEQIDWKNWKTLYGELFYGQK